METLIKWFAPILSFTTEEIFSLICKDKKSIHLERFMNLPKNFSNEKLNKKWTELKKIRDVCNVSIEEKRVKKDIGSSLEASLIMDIDFSELCITSSAIVEKSNTSDIEVETSKAKGKKCSVCWKISERDCERHPICNFE